MLRVECEDSNSKTVETKETVLNATNVEFSEIRIFYLTAV